MITSTENNSKKSGVPQKMIDRYIAKNAFVCVSDITSHNILLNDVLFNPILPQEKIREILYQVTLKHFNYELNNDELAKLSSYGLYDSLTFIKEFKKIINI